MNITQQPTYRTSDLSLAATLSVKGYKLVSLDRSHSPKVAFLFERDSDLDWNIQQYWADQLSVNPKSYFDALKHLKSRIYAG